MGTSPYPQHVALIMDGNRRWAEEKGLPKLEGHRQGLNRTKEIVDECLKLGIGYCSLWCFSTENWQRDQKEVDYLMRLFEEYLLKHVDELDQKGIRIVHIGRKDRLPKKVARIFAEAEEKTRKNTKMILNLAIDYGGRDEVLRAISRLNDQNMDFTEANFSLCLDTVGSPDPDLIIRTSGEKRLSGFMIWQSAYSELHFTEKCFPDFTVSELHLALEEYSRRNRTKGI